MAVFDKILTSKCIEVRRFAILIILAITIAGAFGAKAPELKFTHYTTADGLPTNCVRAIVQDEDGFIWFGADGGLVRFDGTATKVFRPQGEEDEEVFVLSLARQGRSLLVGTERGLYRYDPVSETLTAVELEYPSDVKARATGNIHAIALDRKGSVWVSSEGSGVFRIEMTEGASGRGEVKGEYPFADCHGFVGSLYIDKENRLWALSNPVGGGLYRYDESKDAFREFVISDKEHLLKGGVLAMESDSFGNYWLGTWENGIVGFDPHSGEAKQLTASGDKGSLWHIHSLMEYAPGQLLAGSDGGLTLVDTSTGVSRVYQSEEIDPHSISDRFVYPIVRDSDGGLWIGTYYRGVNYVASGSQRFRNWSYSKFANSVSGNVVSRLCEDERGNLWLGTADGGLSVYDPERNIFRLVRLTGSGQPENITALCADGGVLWIGTYSGGAGMLDISSGVWRMIPFETPGPYSCYAILKDSKGSVWIGATETLGRYNAERGLFEKVSTLGAWITDIDEDRAGEIWISTQGAGLYRYNSATGKRVNYRGGTSGLPNDHINSVKIDNGGEVYVATSRGVYAYDRGADRFEALGGDAGRVSAQAVEKVGDDLWISTGSGILNVKGDGKHRYYGIGDGLSDLQFLPGASAHTADGKLYYGTVHGFTRVDPVELRATSGVPRVVFTGLDIVNERVGVGDERLPKSLNDIERLVLTHADHTFSVYFSALSYANPGGNSYVYKLEGFDKDWLEAGKDNRATYSNLPPGSYTLRVKGGNSDGVWNEEGISLRIEVKPAWYASALMKGVYVILGLALLLVIVRFIVKRMERAHIEELDRISSNKEKEMFRSKLNFFTIVAHEIRTPVSLIIGPLEKILGAAGNLPAGVREDLEILDRNSRRLLSLVNQLLDFKKVDDNPLPMGFRRERIVPLVRGVADRFRPSLEHKGIRLVEVYPDEELEADVDPEALTKLVSNLLNNARKFTKSEIRIECRAQGSQLMISVSDDGIGISKEHRDKIFKPFFQVLDNINESKGGTGLGLSIVKSVAEAHGGTIELESTPGRGSRFEAVLPLSQAKVLPAEERAPAEEDGMEIERSAEGEDKKPVLLVVDDNEEMLRFISSHFEKRYRVVTAQNGREGLEVLQDYPVSMIVCDWMMPVMDGEEMLRAVRGNGNTSHIPFVMLTAKTDNTSKITSMRSGADAYVEKPFSIGYLDARMENLLQMRARLREKYASDPTEPIETMAPTQIDSDLLSRMQALIEAEISNPELNVDWLAEKLGISRSGLYAKIKSIADVTPRELIQVARLKKGAEYLATGKYQVQEVSYMVGFSNSSYFSKCFQKQFGVRPADYQKK